MVYLELSGVHTYFLAFAGCGLAAALRHNLIHPISVLFLDHVVVIATHVHNLFTPHSFARVYGKSQVQVIVFPPLLEILIPPDPGHSYMAEPKILC